MMSQSSAWFGRPLSLFEAKRATTERIARAERIALTATMVRARPLTCWPSPMFAAVEADYDA